MYKIESRLYEQLCLLRDRFSLCGIKAEFEAEGSSFRDIVRLRRLTQKANVALFLKIGGVEALRDLKDSLEIGVDGVIAPMVESEFGAKKFYDSVQKIYKDSRIFTTLNIETRTSIDNARAIMAFAYKKFDSITIGRSDLSASYFDQKIKPDSDFIFSLLENLASLSLEFDLPIAVGGGLSATTLHKFNTEFSHLAQKFAKLETRKVILPASVFLSSPNALKEALIFEELYILSKKEFSDLHIDSEITRLTELQRRIL
ncbi:aldolase/citrate lyase family protein [Helicobacter himalayensis]|uniref:aldolase/citrate lyase family protein n=1 Tax=Helicobacter himalayensis TaxID=1591088 RepID=UPI003D6F28E8